MAESEAFDPYRKWLGIPPAEQPPTHYRLLGIAEFENDPDVISHAADRSMAHVRTFQTGAKAELSQRILNELASTRRMLLTPELKALYDADLRLARQQPLPPPPPPLPTLPTSPLPLSGIPAGHPVNSPLPPPPPIPTLPTASLPYAEAGPMEPGFGPTPSSSAARQRARKKSSPLPLLLGATAVMGVVVLVVLTSRSPQVEESEHADAPTAKIVPQAIPLPTSRSKSTLNHGEYSSPNEPQSSHVVESRGQERRFERRNRGDDNPRGPAKNIDEALDRTHRALTRNRPNVARRHLQESKELAAANDAQRHRRAALEKLIEYLERFHRALESGAAQLKPGANFVFDRGNNPLVLTFREYDRRERELRFDTPTGSVRRRLEEIPPDWAMPIARPMLTGNDERSKLAIAAYQSLHPAGNRQTARLLWEEALAAGIVPKALVDELRLSSSEIVPELPEMKIVLPTEKPDPEKPDPEKKPEIEPKAVARVPLPDSAALVEAKKLFREAYREKLLKARSAVQRTELANEMYQAGLETSDNPAQKYVLWTEALEVAVGLADAGVILPIVDDLAKSFEIDALELKSTSLTKAIAASSGKEQGIELYRATLNIFVEATESARFEVAAGIARSAANAARRAGEPKAAKLAEEEGKKMEALADEAKQKKSASVPEEEPK